MEYEERIKRIRDAITSQDYEKALLALSSLERLPNLSDEDIIQELRLEAYLIALKSKIKEAEDYISESKRYSAISSLSDAEIYLEKLKNLGYRDLEDHYSKIERLKPLAYKMCVEQELKIAHDLLEREDYSTLRNVLSRIEKYVNNIPKIKSSKISDEMKEFRIWSKKEIESLRVKIKGKR